MKIITKRSLILTSITTLVLVMSVNSHSKIYKWTDANGQTHYTATPPSQQNRRIESTNIEDKIKSNAGKSRGPTKTGNTASDDDDDDTEATDSTEAGEELAGPNKELTKYCDNQRNNLAQLQKNFRNVWVDVTGKQTSLNQDQRKEKVDILKTQIAQNCAEVKVSENS